MQTTVFQEKTATAKDFAEALCALVREEMVGLVTEVGENGFTFSLPGETAIFRVCVTEERAGKNTEKTAEK